jgi:hypothetical protein
LSNARIKCRLPKPDKVYVWTDTGRRVVFTDRVDVEYRSSDGGSITVSIKEASIEAYAAPLTEADIELLRSHGVAVEVEQ